MPMTEKHKQEARDFAHQLENLARLMTDPHLQKVLDQFHDDPAARHQAATDLHGYLQKQGVTVPAGVKVRFWPDNWFLGLTTSKWRLGYDSESGWCIFC